MIESVNFLEQTVLSSSALLSNKDRESIKLLIELKLVDKKPEEITFGDLVNYTSKKIKSGLKSASFHKRAILALKEIFEEHDPEDAKVFNKILPLKLQQRQSQVA